MVGYNSAGAGVSSRSDKANGKSKAAGFDQVSGFLA